MATAWTLTANDIIKQAMLEVNALDIGLEPTGAERDICLARLNAMLNSYQLRGVNLFREETVDITTTAATATKTLPADVRTISTARLVNSATSERPLYPIDRTRYFQLPNKTTAGSPTMYYLERTTGPAILHLWPVSATPVTIRLDYQRGANTIAAGTDTLDIPQDWQEAIYKNLAVDIAPLFGSQVSPSLAARAQTLELDLLNSDRPDSYYFERDHCA